MSGKWNEWLEEEDKKAPNEVENYQKLSFLCCRQLRAMDTGSHILSVRGWFFLYTGLKLCNFHLSLPCHSHLPIRYKGVVTSLPRSWIFVFGLFPLTRASWFRRCLDG
jgi:hypothetical protein